MSTWSDKNAQGMVIAQTDETVFLDPETIKWTKWTVDGVNFKILHITPDMKRCTVLFHSKPHLQLPVHEHVDEVFGYVIKGIFQYLPDEQNPAREIGPGGFLYEPAGTVHRPYLPEELIMMVTFFGPVNAFEESGKTISTTNQDLYSMAKANGAVSHLVPK
jgi:quercetin dioxygenase-like cupin family protein